MKNKPHYGKKWKNVMYVRVLQSKRSQESYIYIGFLGGADGKESACNIGDRGSILGLGISREECVYVYTLYMYIYYPKDKVNIFVLGYG